MSGTDKKNEENTIKGAAAEIAGSQSGCVGEGQLPAEIERAPEAKTPVLHPELQALWGTILPLVGFLPSQPDEYPGLFRVEPGPEQGDATVYIDIPSKPYERGKPPSMDRVVSLTVRLAHDYRKLGNRYYCVDCDIPVNETRH